MQIKDLDGQVSMFGPGLPCGKTSLDASAAPRTASPARTSGKSLKRSYGSKNHTLMLLDLRPGAGNMLGSYWEYDPVWLGRLGPLNTSECPKGAVESSLSQILQAQVPSKYYLSKTACLGILHRAEERGKSLPPQLELALKLQAGIVQPLPGVHPAPPLAFHINQREETIDLGETAGALMRTQNMQIQTFVTQMPRAFAANQRDEVRDLHDLVGALSVQPGMKQQTFIANCMNQWDTQQSRIFTPEGTAPTLASADGGGGRNPGGLVYTAGFSANAGSKAGGIGYHEELTPTLKGTGSGGMMPSVLCLNDQGGSFMNCSEDVTGTLRAQTRGHQPLIFENHGIDARYTGPHEIVPTLSARSGTGGNNLPIALQGAGSLSAFFSRSRTDKFSENDLASTESARQYKDVTDLVCQRTYQETVGALTRSDHKGPNNQYVGQDKLVVVNGPLLIRRLVPQECELLQGFPPDWTDLPGASDSARYKALGNSIAIPCVEYLMQGIALVLRAGL